MTMDLIWGVSWLWYLAGFLGVGGTIAFVVLAPAEAGMVFQSVFRFLLTTRPGWALMALLIAVPLTDIHRSKKDEAAFAQRTAEFEEKQKERDATIASDTRKQVTAELAEEVKANTKVDTDVDAFQKELPPAPPGGNPFLVGTDVCKLRVIAGLACDQDRGANKGVPKAGTKIKGPRH